MRFVATVKERDVNQRPFIAIEWYGNNNSDVYLEPNLTGTDNGLRWLQQAEEVADYINDNVDEVRVFGDSQTATIATEIISGIATALDDFSPAVRDRIVSAARRAVERMTRLDETGRQIARSMIQTLGPAPDHQETGTE